MGRPQGSKNGQGGVSSAKSIFGGKRTTNASGKLNGNNSKGTNEDSPNRCCAGPTIDRSQTNFPYDIRIHGFSSLMNTMRKANQRVRKLILDECDIILECRVCRNLFRSLPNFLAHKQQYCKNEFNPSADAGFTQFIQSSSTSFEFQYHLDQSLLESITEDKELSSTPATSKMAGCHEKPSKEDKASRLHRVLRRIAPEIENATRTPSAFYSDILMRKNNNSQSSGDSKLGITSEKVNILLEPLSHKSQPPNGVIFQKTIPYDPSNCDVSRVQTDNRKICENSTAVLGPDGKIICVGDAQAVEEIVNKVVAQVEELQDEQQRRQMELKCPECRTLFPTRKTLRMHVRAAHRSTPEHEEEQILQAIAESKLMYEKRSADCNESSGDMDQRCSTPPVKKIKSDDSTSNALGTSMGQSDSKSSSSTENVLPSSKSVSVSFNSSSSFSSSKRPRGRPRKNSNSSKNDSPNGDSKNGRILGSESTGRPRSSVELIKGKLSPCKGTIFSCLKCPQRFGTNSEMSAHVARCNGLTENGFLQRQASPSPSPSTKKIGIQIRRDYKKEDDDDGIKVNNTSESAENNNAVKNPGSYKVNGFIHKHRSKLDWSRYSPAKSKSNSSSTTSTTYKQHFQHKTYNNKPKPDLSNNNKNRNKFGQIVDGSSGCSISSDVDAGMGDDEQEDDDDECNPEVNCASDSSSGDYGLPFEVDKMRNGDEMDVDTDRDSNVTDSGVSTTSLTTKSNVSRKEQAEVSTTSQAVVVLDSQVIQNVTVTSNHVEVGST